MMNPGSRKLWLVKIVEIYPLLTGTRQSHIFANIFARLSGLYSPVPARRSMNALLHTRMSY